MTKLILFFATIIFGIVSAISAENYSSIRASATVLPALTVRSTCNLEFGNVLPGIMQKVDKSSPENSGSWTITGPPNAEISIEFTLPENLRSESENLEISFSPNDCSYINESPANQINPSSVHDPNTRIISKLSPDGDMKIWIGGSVNPSDHQKSGTYNATIRLSVNFTGN